MRFILLFLFLVNSAMASVPSIALYSSDYMATEDRQNISRMMPVTERDVVASVAKQAQAPGNVILWVNGKDAWAVANFENFLKEALKYPGKFTHVFIYDEVYWTPVGYVANYHRKEIEWAADLAHAHGFKTIVTILPHVIHQPDFELDLSKFDVVAVDPYPSIYLPTDIGTCTFSANYLETLVACTVQKLRAKGYKGFIGYIYQAFGIKTESHEALVRGLTMQRQAVCNAKALGVDVTMPFGLHLGQGELQREPWIFSFANTVYEWWVRPC